MRRPLSLAAVVATVVATLAVAAPAAARVDTAMLRGILVRANDDLRACRVRHELPAGRYLVRLVVDMQAGKVERVVVAEAPEPIRPAAESCLEAAYTRLAFPSVGPARPAPPSTRTVGARTARVPPAPRRRRVPSIGTVAIAWPFVLSP